MRKKTWLSRLVTLGIVVCLGVSLITLTGCKKTTTDETPPASDGIEEATFPVTVTDDAGREVTVDARPERIVSLAPANTEIVYALGLLDALVGVTTFDDYPPEVADIEKIGDFVTPNLEAIAAAEADLVLATTGVQADLIEQLEAAGAVVVAVDPQTMEDLYAAIQMVGDVLGEPAVAQDLVAQMQAEVERIQSIVADEDLVTCFVEIAQDPLFTVGEGTLIHDLVELAGGQNVVMEPGYVAYSVEQLLEDDPTVYLATLGSMSDPSTLAERPGFDALSSVSNERVAVLTDNLVSRPGPRVVEGLEEIARALHPDLFEDSE